MALTVSVVKRNVVGAQKEVIADVTFDSSYPNTGGTIGEPFSPTDVDPLESADSVFHFVGAMINDATTADYRVVGYDTASECLILMTTISSGANAQAANASDQSAVKIRVLCRYGQVTG
jgi:hypothetical protein